MRSTGISWKSDKTTTTNVENEIRTILERTLTCKARMNACKDRVAETERVKERTELEWKEVQGMCHGTWE